MIYDTLEHVHRYDGIHPGVMQGLRFLAETDFSQLEDGRITLDGENLFVNVMTCQTKSVNDRPEAHRKYIDIQYLISGEELIGVGPLEEMQEIEGKPEKDVWFYKGQVSNVSIGRGRFAVLFPEDAHAPSIAVQAPATVRKCVVKVLADWTKRSESV